MRGGRGDDEATPDSAGGVTDDGLNKSESDLEEVPRAPRVRDNYRERE